MYIEYINEEQRNGESEMNIERSIVPVELKNEMHNRDAQVAKWIFEGLKPLRAACNSSEFDFLAYLIEMTETEAHRLMTAKKRQAGNS